MKRKLALFFCALTCALLIAFNSDAMAAAREGVDMVSIQMQVSI